MPVLTQNLKNAVLQAAIEGKLTEQLVTDSSVDELLKTINKKKEQLIKAGKIKKEKKLPPILKDEMPFDIPETWKMVYLGDLFKHNAGKALNSKNTKGVLKKYITTSNVYWDHFELDNLKEMYYTEDEIEKYSVEYGDLLVLEGGDVGRAAIWDLNESFCIQNHIHRLRPYIDLNVKFYHYVLYLNKQKNLIEGRGIGIKGLSSSRLHQIVVPLPPIEEQQRIVDKLKEIMPLIDEYEKLENQLVELKKQFPEDMKASILQAAMEGKLTKRFRTDSDVDKYIKSVLNIKKCLLKNKKIKKDKTVNKNNDEFPFDIPVEWRWIKFGNLATLKSGKTPPRSEPIWWGNEKDIPWVSVSDMNSNGITTKTKEYISEEGVNIKFNNSISQAGTMIMSFKLTIGRISILGMDALHNEAIISIIPFFDEDNILQKYLFKVLPLLVRFANTKNDIKGANLN